MSVTFQDIEAAAKRLEGHIVRTPCTFSQRLSAATHRKIWVKSENQQFTSAFKERGALNKILSLSESERARGVFAASAGNHGQGLAYHAQRLGIPATIVMPVGTPFVKVQKTQSFGAIIVIEGANYDEASKAAQTLCEERQGVYVHPFNDRDVIIGQGTIAIEMLEQAPELDTLLVPIGGGGLIAGVAIAAKAIKPWIKIIGVEAAMFPSFTARRRNMPVPMGGSTIAEGIAVKEVGDLSFELANPHVDDVVVIDEADFERGIAAYANVEKTVAEGAGAAGLGAIMRFPERFKDQNVGTILCGGNIDLRLLASVLQRELVREKRLVTYRILGDDRPGMLSLMADTIAAKGGNIVDVAHNRLVLDVPAKGAEFDIMVETQDARHAFEISEALRSTGYALRMD
ncbi:threonine dehydratase [Asticcacaulis biprosthecium C19]|uniref:L-threonine dehydratase catabolic TdcB n=1 Tax=Asticcacaulis biprosthecium C19 TaxID=715226 RepID=F4QLA2_9CAUL|nr:threonine ammonia-lyase [Asticcacaulis biprosthecium]EGF92247.1 threonine dehydratase [Asticcacaulis biprosthecium C19]